MMHAILECEPHMVDVIDRLVPAGVSVVSVLGSDVAIDGPLNKIPAAIVRLHTTLSKSGKRRCKLVPA